MSEIATLKTPNILELPAEVGKQFRAADRFLVWLDGDMIHLKLIAPSATAVVDEAPAGEPMTMDEINDIVHEVRRRRQH